MERILALDIGDRTIGLAISDLLHLTGQPLFTIRRGSKKEDFHALKQVIEEYDVKKLLVGLPINMNGSLGPQAEKVTKFAKEIGKEFDLEVVFIDERLTTLSAERVLIEGDVSRKKRKDLIDKLAASHILQSYLDSKSRGRSD